MIGKLAAFIFLSSAYCTGPAEVLSQLSVTVTDVGGTVTVICPASDKEGKFFHWFKQPLGFLPQSMCAGVLHSITVNEQFRESRFTFTNRDDQNLLTIGNVSRWDEATYFCQTGSAYSQTVANGTFVAVREHNQQNQLYVKQSLTTGPDESVTPQCSLRSSDNDKAQCPDVHSVQWFTAGSSFHPGIVYRSSNVSGEQEKRSCAYSLSKTTQDPTDGSYYCAVATCGRILFGEGTKVEKRPGPDPVALVLGLLLVCSLTVIGAFIVYERQRKGCKHCKGGGNGPWPGSHSATGQRSASSHNGRGGSAADGSSDLAEAAEPLNYAALNFSANKAQRTKAKAERLCSSAEQRRWQHQAAS